MAAREQQRKIRVLAVDDEPEILSFYERCWRNDETVKLTTTLSSTVALKLISQKAQEFDLLLTDQRMPGLSGAELAEHVRSNHPELPIVAITAVTEEFPSNLANSVLSEPVGLKELKSCGTS